MTSVPVQQAAEPLLIAAIGIAVGERRHDTRDRLPGISVDGEVHRGREVPSERSLGRVMGLLREIGQELVDRPPDPRTASGSRTGSVCQLQMFLGTL